ncbi:MAG: hypothetical protein OXC40_03745 [Proteobacteria bacterium]|nr:hypothetical protein [Pseudomonadota bacterium]
MIKIVISSHLFIYLPCFLVVLSACTQANDRVDLKKVVGNIDAKVGSQPSESKTDDDDSTKKLTFLFDLVNPTEFDATFTTGENGKTLDLGCGGNDNDRVQPGIPENHRECLTLSCVFVAAKIIKVNKSETIEIAGGFDESGVDFKASSTAGKITEDQHITFTSSSDKVRQFNESSADYRMTVKRRCFGGAHQSYDDLNAMGKDKYLELVGSNDPADCAFYDDHECIFSTSEKVSCEQGSCHVDATVAVDEGP